MASTIGPRRLEGKLRNHFVYASNADANVYGGKGVKVVCLHCHKRLTYCRSNTSLNYHLKHKHPSAYQRPVVGDREVKEEIDASLTESLPFQRNRQPSILTNCSLTPTILFTSRSIEADGTSKTTTEFFCNFCHFKVVDRAEYDAHVNTHVFFCGRCQFKATTRLDVLLHKKESHPECSEELAGYRGLGDDLPRPTSGTLKCSSCEFVDGDACVMATHILTEHDNKEMKFCRSFNNGRISQSPSLEKC